MKKVTVTYTDNEVAAYEGVVEIVTHDTFISILSDDEANGALVIPFSNVFCINVVEVKETE